MIRGTLKSARSLLTKTGELHLIIHTNKLGINQFDVWGLRQIVEDENFVWRASLPFGWRLLHPYAPKNVEGKPWTPSHPQIVILTPRNSGWKVEKRCWRPGSEQENVLLNNMKQEPLSATYTDPKTFDFQTYRKQIFS